MSASLMRLGVMVSSLADGGRRDAAAIGVLRVADGGVREGGLERGELSRDRCRRPRVEIGGHVVGRAEALELGVLEDVDDLFGVGEKVTLPPAPWVSQSGSKPRAP